jgi:hypothetical protein
VRLHAEAVGDLAHAYGEQESTLRLPENTGPKIRKCPAFRYKIMRGLLPIIILVHQIAEKSQPLVAVRNATAKVAHVHVGFGSIS